jgi:hypothetical protein
MHSCQPLQSESSCCEIVKEQRKQIEVMVGRIQEVDRVLGQERARREVAEQTLEQQQGEHLRALHRADLLEADSHELKLIVVRLEHDNQALKDQLQGLSAQLHEEGQHLEHSFIQSRLCLEQEHRALAVRADEVYQALQAKTQQCSEVSCRLEKEKVARQGLESDLARCRDRLKEAEDRAAEAQSVLQQELARNSLSVKLAREQQLVDENQHLRTQLAHTEENTQLVLEDLEAKLATVKEHWRRQQQAYEVLLAKVEKAQTQTRKEKAAMADTIDELETRVEELTLTISSQREKFIEALDQQFTEKEELLQKLYRT